MSVVAASSPQVVKKPPAGSGGSSGASPAWHGGLDRGSNVSNTTRGQLVGRRTTPYDERIGPRVAQFGGPLSGDQQARGAVVAGRVPDGRECVVERLRVVGRNRHQLDHGQAVSVLGS